MALPGCDCHTGSAIPSTLTQGRIRPLTSPDPVVSCLGAVDLRGCLRGAEPTSLTPSLCPGLLLKPWLRPPPWLQAFGWPGTVPVSFPRWAGPGPWESSSVQAPAQTPGSSGLRSSRGQLEVSTWRVLVPSGLPVFTEASLHTQGCKYGESSSFPGAVRFISRPWHALAVEKFDALQNH